MWWKPSTSARSDVYKRQANGMPVVFRTVVKPTPSIYKQQDTVDYLAKKDAQLSIQGRHDPCIVPRAAIVQTCAAALAVGDLLTARYGAAWMTHPTSFRKAVSYTHLDVYKRQLVPLLSILKQKYTRKICAVTTTQ